MTTYILLLLLNEITEKKPHQIIEECHMQSAITRLASRHAGLQPPSTTAALGIGKPYLCIMVFDDTPQPLASLIGLVMLIA